MRSFILPLLCALLPSTVLACAASGEDADDGAAAISDSQLKDIGHRLDGVTAAEVLTKNEDGFAAKLALIDASKPGESLDISYYIFADDESGALYATRLVEAAKRGVKIRVMLDYLTNFTRYNYFKTLQDTAGGPSKLEFRFYNKPNANIVHDVKYLVTPCSLVDTAITDPACTTDRRAKSTSAESEAKSKMFLSGLYSKNAGALQASMGEVLAQYDAAFKAAPTTSPDDKQKAIEALKLVFDAKIKGEIGASLLVFFAGDKLAPINNVFSALIPEAADDGEHANDWMHLTDFTHQKLTLRRSANGGGDAVVGGRNIANSYQITELPPESNGNWAKNYIFMDVDSHVTFAKSSVISERFDKIWGFDTMVATMSQVEALTPIDLQVPVIENGAPTGATLPLLTSYTYEQIFATSQRFRSEYATYDNAGKLTIKFRGKAIELAEAGQFPKFDASKDPDARYTYFDNVPNPNGKRVFGADIGFGDEKKGGKEIQELWARSLKDYCAKGDGKGGKVEIIFHNAYLSLPSRMQYELFARTSLLGNGTRFECEKGVSKVRIITNSRESTDLSVVNVYNDPWMKPTIEADRQRSDGNYFLDYREYNTQIITSKNPISRSLHAKVMIFGNDIFVGSANADGRSEFMDSNNGVFISNAPNLVAAYKKWLTGTIEPQLMNPNEDPRGLRGKSGIASIAQDNASFMATFLRGRETSESTVGIVQSRILKDNTQVYDTASRCLPAYDKSCLEAMDKLLMPF